MICSPRNGGRTLHVQQRGAAILLTLVLLGLLIAIFVVILTSDLVRQNTRQRQTAEALAKAKEALIGFAVGVDIGAACGSTWNCKRPGELPCPDLDDDGSSDACNDQDERLGRLPWRTLDLPDLRDGDGERLWYAVSNKYKNSPRTQCSDPADPDCLNSESPGTILLSDKDGTVVNDGSDPNPPSGAVAVIISPGEVLQRDGAGSPQDRSCSGGACSPANDPAGTCFTNLPAVKASQTAKCNPVNYLDVVQGGEDTANFIDGDSFNGLMNGPVFAGSRQIVNDAVLPVKYEDIMPLVERRVAKEAMNCLDAYALESFGRYPWAASVNASTGSTYIGQIQYRFGRLPDDFSASLLGLIPDTTPALGPVVGTVCDLASALCVKDAWPTTAGPFVCTIPAGGAGWWMNWKDSVFYGFAADYVPSAPPTQAPLTGSLITLLNSLLGGLLESLLPGYFEAPSNPAACGTPGSCLTVNPPSLTAGRKVVVIVSGRKLAGQQRFNAIPAIDTANRRNIANYLENPNGSNLGGPIPPNFAAHPRSTTFNDFLLYQ